jgi:hypothetical protein
MLFEIEKNTIPGVVRLTLPHGELKSEFISGTFNPKNAMSFQLHGQS